MQQKEELPLDLVSGIYEAALEPDLWAGALEQVQDYLGGASSVLYVQDMGAMHASFSVCNGIDPERMRAYHDYYVLKDPCFLYRQDKPAGVITLSHKLLTDAEFEETEYYRDFLRQFDLFYSAGTLVERDGERFGTFGVLRPRQQGPFDDSDLARIRALFPHLRRALEIDRKLAGREIERQAMLALLERLPTGVLLLDDRGRVVFLNRRAEAILAAGDGLMMTPEGIAAGAPNVHEMLQRLIHEAVQTGMGKASHAGGGLIVPTRSGPEPYQVLVTPLRTARLRVDVGHHRICAALFVHLRDTPPVLEPGVLRDLFGLTPAETRVTMALVQGRKPEEIAAEASASRFTVRAQLSSIYEKVGVHRQAELVQRVLSSPAALGPSQSEEQPGGDAGVTVPAHAPRQ